MTKLCKHCKKEFDTERSYHFYCSSACRVKASMRRNAYIPQPDERDSERLKEIRKRVDSGIKGLRQ